MNRIVSSQKGAYLVEFIIIIPVIFFLVYGTLHLNSKSESIIYIQQGIQNLQSDIDDDQITNSDEALKAGFKYAHFSQTLKEFQEGPELKAAVKPFEKKGTKTIDYLGSDTYKTFLKVQNGVANIIFDSVISNLAEQGIFFDSVSEMKSEVYEYIESESKMIFDQEFVDLSKAVSDTESAIVPLRYFEQATYAPESGYHPNEKHDNLTAPGIVYGFASSNANHWGVFSNQFYSGRKPRSKYRTENFVLGLIGTLFSTTEILLSQVDDKFLDDLYADKDEWTRSELKNQYNNMTHAQKKEFINRLKRDGQTDNADGGELGFLARRLLSSTGLKKGYTLNCSFNFRVSSNCITTSMYGTILPIAAMIVVIVKVIGAGGASVGDEAVQLFKQQIRQTLTGMVADLGNQIKDQFAEKIKESFDGIEEKLKNKIEGLVKDKVSEILEEVENSEVLGQKL